MGNVFDGELLWEMKFTSCILQVLSHTVVPLVLSGFSLVNIEPFTNNLITSAGYLAQSADIALCVPGTRHWLLVTLVL